MTPQRTQLLGGPADGEWVDIVAPGKYVQVVVVKSALSVHQTPCTHEGEPLPDSCFCVVPFGSMLYALFDSGAPTTPDQWGPAREFGSYLYRWETRKTETTLGVLRWQALVYDGCRRNTLGRSWPPGSGPLTR